MKKRVISSEKRGHLCKGHVLRNHVRGRVDKGGEIYVHAEVVFGQMDVLDGEPFARHRFHKVTEFVPTFQKRIVRSVPN